MKDLIQLTAVEAVGLLRQREVSSLELVEAAIERIEETNGRINALCTLCFERARQHARRLTEQKPPSEAEETGWLAGLPVAIKDTNDVAGVRTTYGSRAYDHVSERSDIMVERIERRGGIVLAISNSPEFAASAGTGTFNDLFGMTVNPWNASLTCSGSSGGSAAALAAGQVWLASGSDIGGSLRQPASFCSVVGLRPSPGRVARAPVQIPFDTKTVYGPMARTVGDAALFLDAMVGQHPRDPLSKPAPPTSFTETLREAGGPRRVAFSATLGLCPVEPEVEAICTAAVRHFETLGASVEESCPDLSDAREIQRVLRDVWLASHWSPLVETHRGMIRPDLVERIEAALTLDVAGLWAAERARGALYERNAAFFEKYDLLACPTAPVPPFPNTQSGVTEIGGQALERPGDWMLLTWAISQTACPALL